MIAGPTCPDYLECASVCCRGALLLLHPPSPPVADLLYGSAKAGKYQFDKILTVASKTADGVVSSLGSGRDDWRRCRGLASGWGLQLLPQAGFRMRRASQDAAFCLGSARSGGGGQRRRLPAAARHNQLHAGLPPCTGRSSLSTRWARMTSWTWR